VVVEIQAILLSFVIRKKVLAFAKGMVASAIFVLVVSN
jgi:hypothetical protein